MILTHAVSNIARSGATRSGYPVLQGAKVPLYAISNLARSGATRSNYTGSQPFISIDGIHRGWGRLDGGGVIADSVTKSDAINNTPVTLTFTAYGWVPVEGADVVITLGSANNLQRQFGGTILSTRHRYAVKKPVDRNMLYDVSCIDYTWALDRRKVSGNYTNASVAAIAASLMTYAPAGYTLRVDPDIGAERLDQITFTEQSLTGAFAQLAKRVGGDFLCDYLKVVHLFFENTALSPPRIVNAVHPTLQTIDWTRDLSQVATRILGNFGGSNALDAVGPGETLLPVETAAWYLAAGGVVLVGQQRVTYGGLEVGGGGSLVGPGAAPTGAPNASLLPGAGVDVGTHDYAVTFKTTNGESIPGPRLTVPVGVFLPPATAPTAGTPTAGPGPDAGVHDYAISFVISTGETVPGPRIAASTALLDPPTTAPTPDRVDPGPGPDPGQHDYAVGFVLYGSVATTPGPIGGQITTGGIPAPNNAPTVGSITAGPGPDLGTHYYATTFARPEGETSAGPLSGPATAGSVTPPSAAPTGSPAAAGSVDAGSHQYACTFVRSGGETPPGPLGPAVTTGGYLPAPPPPVGAPFCQQYPTQGNYPPSGTGRVGDSVRYALSGNTIVGGLDGESAMGPASPPVIIQAALAGAPNQCLRTVTIAQIPAQYTSAQLYVSVNGGLWLFLQFVAPPTTPTTIGVNGLGSGSGYPGEGHGPAANTVALANLPTSADATVTARKLYRQSGGAGLRFLATISDNTTRTYTDTTPNASLGAAPPTVNGTLAGVVHVFGIQTAPAGAGVIARKLYRYTNVGTWGLVATIADNTTTSYTDTTPNASLGAAPPGGNTTTGGNQAVHLSGLPTVSGPNGTAAWRQLYRRSAGAGLRFVANIPDNTTRTYTDTTPNASLGAAPSTVNNAVLHQIPLTKIPIGNALVVSRKIYRTPANTAGGPLKLVTTIADNTTTDVIDTVPDASLGALALIVGTAQAAQVQLSAIPLGAASVIARGLYRTKAGVSQLQALVILGDNTTTTYLDTVVDAALGANAPTSDTSLLQQPTGNVLAGSPTLPCATVAAFRPTGGWAIVGSQNIRYTGISGNALLGIPPSGAGAITATITWNTTVVAAAMLTGIPATGLGVIKYQILKGDPVNLFVQVDDLDAQAAVRLQLAGSDGIIEDEIQDGRLSYLEGVARCQARLDLLGALDSEGKVGVITVSYVCRDLNTQAGATVTINLGPPINLRGDFLIQRVGVARFNIPNLTPTYTAEASSLRFSAEEMLRLLRQGAF